MRPPSNDLADLDWFIELRTSFPLLTGMFTSFRQNPHFKRAASLGDVGTRARIMMLLLWVVGHRLTVDRRRQLVSTAIDDGLAVMRPEGNTSLDFLELVEVQDVIEQLVRMIGTRLPLPKENNPFYGADFIAEDEDKPIPRQELWVYERNPKGLPPSMLYEFDVRRNPNALLRRHETLVLVPQTKLSLLMIQWLSRNFGLGKKVFSPFHIDPRAFWNADPPPSDEDLEELDGQEDDISMGSTCIREEYGGPDMIFEAFQDLPLEKWIHFRFCRSYMVHGWAHDGLARTLLFNSYCGDQTLPKDTFIYAAIQVSRYIRTRLVEDIVEILQIYVMTEAMKLWLDVSGEVEDEEWDPPFQEMAARERGLMVIFSDAAKESLDVTSLVPPGPPLFQRAYSFLIDPAIDCPGVPDVMNIIKEAQREEYNAGRGSLPTMDHNKCTCGRCTLIHQQLVRGGLENFQIIYLAWMRSVDSRRSCNVLEDVWEPQIREAEQWVDSHVLNRIETSLDPFPSTDRRTLGIAALHVLKMLNVDTGEALTNSRLLRLVSSLRYSHLYPDSFLEDKYLSADEKDLLGFVTAEEAQFGGMDLDEDLTGSDTSQFDDDFDFDPEKGTTLCVSGGWLYHMAQSILDVNEEGSDSSPVYILSESSSLSVNFLSSPRPGPQALHMAPIPSRSSFSLIMPPSHNLLDAPETADPDLPSSQIVNTHSQPPQLSLDLSDDNVHGFPFLSADGAPHITPNEDVTKMSSREGYTIQITAFYCHRIYRTWWRPQVVVGNTCPHKDQYHRISCCSMTSNQILLQVSPRAPSPWITISKEEYPSSQINSIRVFNDTPSHASGQDSLNQYLEYIRYTTAKLSSRDGPLAEGRICLVRCSDPSEEGKEGPVDPLIILAASLKRKVYIIHSKECCLCACDRMRAVGYSIGIIMTSRIRTRTVTKCGHCTVSDHRASHIIESWEESKSM